MLRLGKGLGGLALLLFVAFFVLAVPGCLPLVSGNWLFAAPSDPGCSGEPEGPAAAVVFDLSGGNERWSRTVGNASRLIVHEDLVVVGGESGVVRGLDGADGSTMWCRELGEPGAFSGGLVAAAGDTIAAVVNARTVVGLDPSTGDELWRTSLDVAVAGDTPDSTIATEMFVDIESRNGVFRVSDGGATETGIVTIDPTNGSIAESNETVDPPYFVSPNITDAERAGVRLRATSEYVENRQERRLVVTDSASGNELWAATVPGYRSDVALSREGRALVMVIDQTGGTGDTANLPQTMLTAYDGRTGERVWQREIPIETRAAHGTETGIVIVPATSTLLGIDAGSGDELWRVDHGSPGKARPYSVTGNYQTIEPLGNGDTAVGLIVAERPYRD